MAAGVKIMESIRRRLGAERGFWAALDLALDRIGLCEDFIGSVPRSRGAGGASKYIKDGVWGMMDFSPGEMAVIDCPLVQRLRGVRQLGFTPLTYPSAEHSRFAHTLGVATVTKRLLGSISDAARRLPRFEAGGMTFEVYDPASDEALQKALVHAALLHDVGHLAFSHAGEAALRNSLERLSIGPMPLIALVDLFRDEGVKSDISEMLSVVFCLSPRFEAFYGRIVAQDAGRQIEQVCCFIAGVPHAEGFPGLANIISGAVVDADKIDYILRDAQGCAIPIGVDVHRVFLNTSLVRIEEDQLEAIGATRGGTVQPGIHFLVNSSGIDTYDEIAHAKATLYRRVYLHQATRNAEQLFVEGVARLCRIGAAAGAPMVDILAFLPLNDQQMLDHLGGFSEARPLVAKLASRRLPKRALVLFREACDLFLATSEILGAGAEEGALGSPEFDQSVRRLAPWRLWGELVPRDPLEDPDRMEALKAGIRAAAIEARRLLDPHFSDATLTHSEPYVGFATRSASASLPEVLVREKNSIGRSAEWTTSEELTTAEAVFRAVDHVYADADWTRWVRLGTLRVVRDRAGVEGSRRIADRRSYDGASAPIEYAVAPGVNFSTDAIAARLGADHDEMVDDLRGAADRGFFGADHRIVPLTRAQDRDCRKAAETLSAFSGQRGWKPGRRSIAAFARQFPVGLRDEAVALAGRIKVLDRPSIVAPIAATVRTLSARHHLAICRFSPNSGSLVGMLFEQDAAADLKGRGHVFCRTLQELETTLADAPRTRVVFLDDQYGSGSQASAQLHQWAGIPKERWPDALRGEVNIDVSTNLPGLSIALKEGRVDLVFAYGTAEGETAIGRAAEATGLGKIGIHRGADLPGEASRMSAPMTGFLREVGAAVLAHCRSETGSVVLPEDCLKDALGYGGHAALLATAFNVPSFTLPALWCPGLVDGRPWTPLLLRRGYLVHLVLG